MMKSRKRTDGLGGVGSSERGKGAWEDGRWEGRVGKQFMILPKTGAAGRIRPWRCFMV